MITKAMLDSFENEIPGTDFKRHHVEKFAFNLNSTTEIQITAGQRIQDRVQK